MPKLHVDLNEHFDRYVREAVASGRFRDAGEVVLEGLRLLEETQREEEAGLDEMRAAVREGIEDLERGDCVTVRSREEMRALLDEIHDGVRSEMELG